MYVWFHLPCYEILQLWLHKWSISKNRQYREKWPSANLKFTRVTKTRGHHNRGITKVWVKKTSHTQNLAISKKSTSFVQSSWNLVKMISSWETYFYQVLWELDKNCRFFINGQFLNVCVFFIQTLNQTK